jgi:hypothetical protein
VRPGQHAASDGSFGRSAGIQIGRAVGLIAVAAVIGIILLHHNGSSATTVAAHGSTTTAPSHPSSTAGTTPSTTATALRPPASVKVLVANGTVAGGAGAGSQHLAGQVSTTLHGQGYDTLAAVNTNPPQNVTASIVYFQPGYEREAAVLAQSLGLPASAVQAMPAQPPVQSLNGANLLVVAGPDLARSASSTTTTTAHTTTTIATTTTTLHR